MCGDPFEASITFLTQYLVVRLVRTVLSGAAVTACFNSYDAVLAEMKLHVQLMRGVERC